MPKCDAQTSEAREGSRGAQTRGKLAFKHMGAAINAAHLQGVLKATIHSVIHKVLSVETQKSCEDLLLIPRE